MLHEITYSIITHLKAQISELNDVVWMYDGVSLTGRAKPFASVEQMPSGHELLASGRTTYDDAYRFQIGLMATSVSERTKLSDKMKNTLRQPNIALLDTSQFPPPEAGFFNCDVLAVTPMPVESAADETNKHRVYLDVEVSVLTN
jgi:hypothetical protein